MCLVAQRKGMVIIMKDLPQCLDFLRELEGLKSVTRTAWTSSGRRESTAEHSWRLAVLAGLLLGEYPELDGRRVLLMALLHDVGERYGGDVSAALRPDPAQKRAEEEAAAQRLFGLLDERRKSEFQAVWQEYEDGATAEARLVKALDKAETILQHNQGDNPPDFDYAFNLEYGREYFTGELLGELRQILDAETRARMGEPSGRTPEKAGGCGEPARGERENGSN